MLGFISFSGAPISSVGSSVIFSQTINIVGEAFFDVYANANFNGSSSITGEAYAEVEVTDTLDSKEDYLKYIDWLVKSEDGRSPLISTDKLGTWNVFGPTEDMGMSFQEQLDEMVSGNSRYTEFKSNNSIDESQKKILGVPPVPELLSKIESVRSRIKKIRE